MELIKPTQSFFRRCSKMPLYQNKLVQGFSELFDKQLTTKQKVFFLSTNNLAYWMFLCVDVKYSERPSLRFLFLFENLLKKEKKRRLSAQNFCSQKSTFCLQAGSMVWTRRVFKKNLSLQNKVNCESKKNFFFFEKWNQFRVLRIDHLECETTTKMFASLSNKQNNTTLPTFQDLWAQKEL